MNIFVTGSAGFVGKNLCENLKNIRDGKNKTRPNIVIDEIRLIGGINLWTLKLNDDLSLEENTFLKEILAKYKGDNPVVVDFEDEGTRKQIVTNRHIWIDNSPEVELIYFSMNSIFLCVYPVGLGIFNNSSSNCISLSDGFVPLFFAFRNSYGERDSNTLMILPRFVLSPSALFKYSGWFLNIKLGNLLSLLN